MAGMAVGSGDAVLDVRVCVIDEAMRQTCGKRLQSASGYVGAEHILLAFTSLTAPKIEEARWPLIDVPRFPNLVELAHRDVRCLKSYVRVAFTECQRRQPRH